MVSKLKTRPRKSAPKKALQNLQDSTPPLAPPLDSEALRQLPDEVRRCECAPCHIGRKDAPCPCAKCHLPRMLVFSDERYVVCWPNSEEHLQVMADFFQLKRGWFHAGGGRGKNRKRTPRYEIPKRRLEEIRAKTIDATPREVLSISQGELPDRFVQTWRENIWARADAVW